MQPAGHAVEDSAGCFIVFRCTCKQYDTRQMGIKVLGLVLSSSTHSRESAAAQHKQQPCDMQPWMPESMGAASGNVRQ